MGFVNYGEVESGDCSDDKQAQKTTYNGIEFRSKLEAKTAQALDNLGIEYEYEPQGYQLSNGMWYRPDFWLPYAGEFIECKGVMKNEDMAKIAGLVKDTNAPVVVISYNNSMLISVNDEDPENKFNVCSGDEIGLLKCTKCGNVYFSGNYDSVFYCLRCQSCGNNDVTTLELVDEVSDGQSLFTIGQSRAADDPFYSSLAAMFNG